MKKQLLFSALCLTLSANAAQTCDANIQASTPDSRFTTTAETVTDNKTGLMWMRCSLGQSGSDCSIGSATSYNWQSALESVAVTNDTSPGGYSDWRLPNMKELASIVEVKCEIPAINANIFPNTKQSYYWSSSPYAGNSKIVWVVTFGTGLENHSFKTNPYFVRLVRDL